ncbi:MAG: phosphomannomutase/phosphoglucomutase [Bacteroidetes bacterium]|nr:phosphomannomutase/phosphoglucomutase [Bacteroidota bacterium]
MNDINWFSLQNGSDIRGVASEGIVGQSINLTPEVVKKLAISFVLWLHEKNSKMSNPMKIAIGRDSRISGPILMDAFMDGILSTGTNGIDCGISSTPAMYMSTIFDETKYDGAVMLTASHLPFNRNGIKFFTPTGGLEKKDITRILEIASNNPIGNASVKGEKSQFDLISAYSNFLVNTIRKEVNHPTNYMKPLSDFHIIVDAGNGSGGFFVDKVLEPLGANTTGSQFLEPDGLFPNHIPNPEDEKAMESIQNAVLTHKADIGIIFDTDVDRSAAVDHTGTGINRNRLIALISSIILEEHPNSTIVTDSITSDGLAAFIETKLGGKHHRFQRGYKNVINEAIRLNTADQECWLAIETSGHAALKENYFLDDGAFLITKILVKAARLRQQGLTLLNLTESLQIPIESKEIRLKILVSAFKEYGNKVINDLTEYVKQVKGWSIVPNNYEGIRVSCDDQSGNGWFLLRLSLHDPVIPLNIESDQIGGVDVITAKLAQFFKSYQELDKSQL